MALLVSSLSQAARAETASPTVIPPRADVPYGYQPRAEPYWEPVALRLESSVPRLRTSLYTGDASARDVRRRRVPPEASCTGDCDLTMLPGDYVLMVHSGEGIVQGTRRIHVGADSRLEIEPRSSSDARAGNALAIAGTSLVILGGVLGLYGAVASGWGCDPEYETCKMDRSLFTGSMVSLGLGATFAIPGFVLLGRTAPRVEQRPLSAGK